jgi:hypothetical protein
LSERDQILTASGSRTARHFLRPLADRLSADFVIDGSDAISHCSLSSSGTVSDFVQSANAELSRGDLRFATIRGSPIPLHLDAQFSDTHQPGNVYILFPSAKVHSVGLDELGRISELYTASRSLALNYCETLLYSNDFDSFEVFLSGEADLNDISTCPCVFRQSQISFHCLNCALTSDNHVCLNCFLRGCHDGQSRS